MRSTLTTMGVMVRVAMIVSMVSFGLWLQRNTVERFRELDLFNDITVFGQSLSSLAMSGFNKGPGACDEANKPEGRSGGRRMRLDQTPARSLDDAALEEILKIPGVVSVEPNISFVAYVRSNGHTKTQTIGGVLVPNTTSRFKEFAAGTMISAPNVNEIVVDEGFVREFGYAKAADAIGQMVDLLTPRNREAGGRRDEAEEALTFFGLPLEDEPPAAEPDGLAARSFRIAGVLKTEEQSGGRRVRGLMPAADLYVPLPYARAWTAEHQDDLNRVALQLARASGALGENEGIGYGSAAVRVSDPLLLADVRQRLNKLGFGSFSFVDEFKQIRTVFLVINSALGLLGGISLLVASLGIANTMIMSILERTREIGIMKAIGAEDREIKLIFFVEAAVIGLTGGVVGTLAAWGIDAVANRLAYHFVLKPQGTSFIDFFSLPPYLWLGAIAFAVLVAIVAALYPATRAARIDPVRALRHD